MKHAYISLVIPVTVVPSSSTLQMLDSVLAAQSRAHEIVIVAPNGPQNRMPSLTHEIPFRGPVTVVTTHLRSTLDGAIIAGLARSVGDFVIEWRGPLASIDENLVNSLLKPSDSGIELVEVVGTETSKASKFFNAAVNTLRPQHAPLRRTAARVYSRHALQVVLSGTAFDSQLDILVAELPVRRIVHPAPFANPPHAPINQRLSNGFSLLTNGTRFGSTVPLMLAAVSAAIGVGAAVYGLGFLLLRGEPPEGWTTLMVVAGLGQAAVLTMLGLTWSRIDSLAKGLARHSDMTAQVQVWAPSVSDQTPNERRTV